MKPDSPLPSRDKEPYEFVASSPGNYSRDIALLHQTQEAHDRQISDLRQTIREGFAATDRNIESLRASFAASRAANWPLVGMFFGLIVTLIGGGWTIVKMHTEGTVSPLAASIALVQQDAHATAATLARISDLQQLTRSELAANASGDAASRDDRTHLNGVVDNLTRTSADNEANRRESDATTRQKLTEIETQFRAEDEARNIQWADMRRTVALLWQKSYGEHYPSDVSYYPHIGQMPATNNGK